MEHIIMLIAPVFVGVAVWLIIHIMGEMITSFFKDTIDDA